MSGESVVHVVDDDSAVRKSLGFLIGSDGLSVRLHESALAYLEAVTGPVGCVVTDVRMPGIDGLAFLRRLKERGNAPPVIVMTGHADVPMAVEAMKEGAFDFIEKPFDDDILLAAIHAALDRTSRGVEEDTQSAAVRARIASLSEREAQVLNGLVAGNANKVIGLELGISPRTVEIYRANVMTKMQAGSLSELVRMVLSASRS